MKMKQFAGVALTILCFSLLSAHAQQERQAFNNKGVLVMLKKGTEARFIMNFINRSPAVNFDLSEKSEGELIAAGAPPEMLEAMKAAMQSGRGVKTPSAPTLEKPATQVAGTTSSENPIDKIISEMQNDIRMGKVIFVEGTPRIMTLAPYKGSAMGNLLLTGLKQSQNHLFSGSHADLQLVTNRQPVFLIFLRDNARPEDQVTLTAAKVTGNGRQTVAAQGKFISGQVELKSVPITIEKRQAQGFLVGVVKPAGPLADGEYILHPHADFYDFGIQTKNPSVAAK